jgi:hypothetical protein
MTRRASHYTDNYADDYESATYDERRESISASEDGPMGHQGVASWRTPGSWGGES